IKILSYKEWRTVKIILSECLHADETCLENRRFTHNDMNFVAVTKSFARATNHFVQTTYTSLRSLVLFQDG
ncbi:hypothetical protein Avbf_16503, partial [Armadillidium vulgare]